MKNDLKLNFHPDNELNEVTYDLSLIYGMA